MSQQVRGINIANYLERKEKGLVSVGKVGDAYAIVVKQFSQEDGSEVKPQVVGIELDAIDGSISTLQKQIESLEQLKADMLAL